MSIHRSVSDSSRDLPSGIHRHPSTFSYDSSAENRFNERQASRQHTGSSWSEEHAHNLKRASVVSTNSSLRTIQLHGSDAVGQTPATGTLQSVHLPISRFHEDIEAISPTQPRRSEDETRDSDETIRQPPTAPTGLESDETLIASGLRQTTVPPHPTAGSMSRSPAPQMALARETAFIFVICSAQIMTQAGLAQLLPSHIIIANYFGIFDPAIQSWFIAAYSLTVGTFILISGRLGDLFGYKPMFVIGYVWFGIFSIVAGASYYSNYILFCFARALQGIGPSILLPNGLALLGATYSPGVKKNLCFALFGACAPLGAWLGMIFAVYFCQWVWWPWTFFVQAIACIAFAALAVIAIVSPPGPSLSHDSPPRTLKAKLSRIDFLGSVTGVTSLVLINVAWNQGPIVGWSTQYVYLLLILGLVILATFFLIETRIAVEPLLPFSSLTSDVSFVLVAVACGWANFGIWVYYFWQFLLTVRNLSPIRAAVQFLPVAPTGFVAAIATGICMSKLRPAVILLIALLAFTISAVLIGTAPVQQTYWGQSFFSLLVAAFGMDMSFPAATVIMSNAVKREHQGVAASLVNTVVNYCVSIGLGVAATVEVHYDAEGTELLKGYRAAWYTGIGFSGMGAVVAFVFLVKTFLKRGPDDGGGVGIDGSEGEKGGHGQGNGNGSGSGTSRGTGEVEGIGQVAVREKEKRDNARKQKQKNRKSIRELARISWVPREKRIHAMWSQTQNQKGTILPSPLRNGESATSLRPHPSSTTEPGGLRAQSSRDYGDPEHHNAESERSQDAVRTNSNARASSDGHDLQRVMSAEEAERIIPFVDV
ncbi:MAG: hypothetical protein Q9160_005954 [Pyrenula sp. 1 TL-2023]